MNGQSLMLHKPAAFETPAEREKTVVFDSQARLIDSRANFLRCWFTERLVRVHPIGGQGMETICTNWWAKKLEVRHFQHM